MMMTVLPLLLESFAEAVESNAWSRTDCHKQWGPSHKLGVRMSGTSSMSPQAFPGPSVASVRLQLVYPPVGSASSSWVRSRLHFFIKVLRLVLLTIQYLAWQAIFGHPDERCCIDDTQIFSVEVVVLVLEDSSSKLGERRWYSFVSPFHRKEIYQGIWTTVGLLGACHI